MTEPTESPIGVAVTATVQVNENHINQGIINNGVIVIQQGARHGTPAARHHAHLAHPAHPAHLLPAKPSTSGTPTTPHAADQPTISFAPDGDRITTYQDKDGAIASYREDKQNGGAVTLTLRDGNGTLTTHGDRRGFELNRIDALGHGKTEAVTIDTYWKSPLDFGGVLDKVNCPNTGLKGTNVLPAITGDVTRDKLQQFAAAHPALADMLSHVPLPATVSGGRQVTFHDAVAQPSEFRACPAHEHKGVVRK